MLRVTPTQLEVLRKIVGQYLPTVKLPSEHFWKVATDETVWLQVVSQVTVVGAARPADKLRDSDVAAGISWHTLTCLSDEQSRRRIWTTLRQIGARYTSEDINKCRKTAALAKNLGVLKEYKGGPKGFIVDVARLPGGSTEKVDFVAKHLSYIKNKGARDFLMSGFGLIRDHIALDTRVVGVLNGIGISIPKESLSNANKYAQLEQDLITQVCRPLSICGAELDQILFINYNEINRRITSFTSC